MESRPAPVSAAGQTASAPSPPDNTAVTYAELRRICAHAGSARTQQTYNVLADSQRSQPAHTKVRYTLAPAERVARRLGIHLRLVVETTVPLYCDQVAEYTLLRYHQPPCTARQRRFRRLANASVDPTTHARGDTRMTGRDVMEECHHCSPWRHTTMGGLVRSGGAQETLIGPGSDQDYMWEMKGAHLHGPNEPPPKRHRDRFTAQVKPLQNDKFCLLYCTKQPQCTHSEPRLFSAAHVRKFNKQLWQPKFGEKIKYDTAGPAVNLQGTALQHEIDVDFVPCLRWKHWPWPRFQERHRPAGWPPAAVVEDIVGYGVHMVPTGVETPNEWRISTSRAEILLVRCLPTTVRMCLQMLKQMKSHITRPLAKELNSYIFKQTAFWLCEEADLARLGPLDVMGRVFSRAAEFVSHKRLQHFFADHVNEMGTFSTEHLQRLRSAIDRVRDNMWTLLFGAPCHHIVPIVSSHQRKYLQAEEARECAARNLTVNALIRQLDALVYDPETAKVSTFDALNQQLASDKQLGYLDVGGNAPRSRDMVELCFMEAAKVCPADPSSTATSQEGKPASQQTPASQDDWKCSGLSRALILLTDKDLQVALKLDGGVTVLDDFLESQKSLKGDRRYPGLSTDLCEPVTNMTGSKRRQFLLNGPLLYGILVGGPRSTASQFWKNCNTEKLQDLHSINAEITTAKPEDPFQLFSGTLTHMRKHQGPASERMTARDLAFSEARQLTVAALVKNLSDLVYDPDTGTVNRFDDLRSRLTGDRSDTSRPGSPTTSEPVCQQLWRAIAACPDTPGLTVRRAGEGPPSAEQLSGLLAILTRQDLAEVVRLDGGLQQLDGLLLSYQIAPPKSKRPRAEISKSLWKPVVTMSGGERHQLLVEGAPSLYGALVRNFPSMPGAPVHWHQENERKLDELHQLKANIKLANREQHSGASAASNEESRQRLTKKERRDMEKAKTKAKRQ